MKEVDDIDELEEVIDLEGKKRWRKKKPSNQTVYYALGDDDFQIYNPDGLVQESFGSGWEARPNTIP